MNLQTKYKQMLIELLDLSQQNELRTISITFQQKLDIIIAKYMSIPFYYSKNFEDYIKQQLNVKCESEQNVQLFMNWRNLIEQFKKTNKILTKSNANLLGTQIETQIRIIEQRESAQKLIQNEDLIYIDDEQFYSNANNKADQMDQKLYEIYSNKILKENKKRDMMEKLKYVLNALQQNAKINISNEIILKAYLYGSFLQGTCFQNDSDIDVILIFKNNQLSYNDTLLFIQTTIRDKLKDEFNITQEVQFNFRVPFIGIQHKKTNYRIDITYENRLAVLNSQLFYTYLNTHQKVKILSVLLKSWAVKKNIKKTDFLTSYALLNMVIYYLISKKYLVSLQNSQFFGFIQQQKNIIAYCKGQKETYKIYTSFEQNIEQIKSKLVHELQMLNEKPLHQLLAELFKFYKIILNHNIRCQQGQQSQKIIITTRLFTDIIGDLKHSRYQEKYISIQDPFDDEYNPGQRWNFSQCYFSQALDQALLQIKDINMLKELFD
ncbi:hypothetical protein ABPG72_010759 [Tetrahymena utriculariae]